MDVVFKFALLAILAAILLLLMGVLGEQLRKHAIQASKKSGLAF